MTGEWTAVRLGRDKRPSTGTVIARGDTEADVLPFWKAGEVAICWSYHAPPPKRLSAAQLGNVRRQRLRRRLEQKHPLFWRELYAQELRDRPDYFDPKEGRQ